MSDSTRGEVGSQPGSPRPTFARFNASGDDNSRQTLDDLPVAVYTTDKVGRLTYYNRAAAALWGREPELGTAEWCSSWKLLALDGTPAAHDNRPLTVAMGEQRPVRGVETTAERPDGSRVAFLPYHTPSFDADGNYTGAVSVLMDITERKEADELFRRQAQRLETLNKIARTIARELDQERVVQMVTDIATELSGAKFGAFFYNMIDAQGESYVLYTLSGAPREAFEKFGMPRNTQVFDPTFKGEGVIRSDDIRKDARYGKMAPHHGMPTGHLPVVSYLAVPVIGRSGEVHGGLFFGHDQPAMFKAETEELIAGIAAHAAIAIENARLHAAAQTEITHRRRAEQAAQSLAAIVQDCDDAILTKDLDGNITSWNVGAQRLFGYAPEEIVGRPVTVLIPEHRLDEEPSILGRIRAGLRVDHYETVRRRKDGSEVEISITVSPVRNADGEIIGASKIARDITERRRAQEKQKLVLREMDHRVKNLFALAGGVVTMSARSARSAAELATDVRDRLGALARAHDLTVANPSDDGSRSEAPTTLHALIRAIVAPYERDAARGERRFVIRGPDAPLSREAATSFALLIHEFATNAAKYGALLEPDGQVVIDCAEDGSRFHLTWEERGGPPVVRRTDGEGFGSMLARGTVKGQLGGEISREWKPEGLKIRIDIPRSRMAVHP
jgi:PAS domain S-box-containing protein